MWGRVNLKIDKIGPLIGHYCHFNPGVKGFFLLAVAFITIFSLTVVAVTSALVCFSKIPLKVRKKEKSVFTL